MTKTGKVVKVTSKPRGMILRVEPQPGPPPVPGEDITYAPLDADDYAAAIAAWTKGTDVDVDGVPPACAGVTLK